MAGAVPGGFQYCGNQCAGVGMLRVGEYLFITPDFDYLAQIHDGYTIGDVPDDTQIVRNEKYRQLIAQVTMVNGNYVNNGQSRYQFALLYTLFEIQLKLH